MGTGDLMRAMMSCASPTILISRRTARACPSSFATHGCTGTPPRVRSPSREEHVSAETVSTAAMLSRRLARIAFRLLRCFSSLLRSNRLTPRKLCPGWWGETGWLSSGCFSQARAPVEGWCGFGSGSARSARGGEGRRRRFSPFFLFLVFSVAHHGQSSSLSVAGGAFSCMAAEQGGVASGRSAYGVCGHGRGMVEVPCRARLVFVL